MRVVSSAEITIDVGDSLLEAMSRLELTAHQIVLVVNDARVLVGVITDGDIRRAILKGHPLQVSVQVAMNRDFQYLREGYDKILVEPLMQGRGIRHLPVVDGLGRPTEVLLSPGASNGPGRTNQVVIMAGGRGNRLRPLTDEIPKPMISVGGVPILEIILRNYASQGFRNVTLVLGYLGDSIRNYFGDGAGFGLNVSYIEEDQPKGTAGSLASIRADLDNPFLVSNADVVSSIDLGALVRAHEDGEFALTVAVRRESVSVPFGVLNLEQGRVHSWIEKPEYPITVSAGIYVMEPSVLAHLDGGVADVPDLVHRLLSSGLTVGAYNFEGMWIDVGTHDSLRALGDLGRISMGGVGSS